MLKTPASEFSNSARIWVRDSPWIDKDQLTIDQFVDHYRHIYPSLKSQLCSWRENGFVIIRQAVPHDLIDAFVNELVHLRANLRKFLIAMEVRGEQTWSKAVNAAYIDETGVKFNNLHVASSYAARLSLANPIVQFLQAIFLAPVVPMQSLSFWKGSQQRTHIDFPYVKQQRRLPRMAASWIALEDIHPESGPLAYFSGAHKTEVSGFFDWNNGSIVPRAEGINRTAIEFSDFLDQRFANLGLKPETFLPRKGDVLIWHANLPHLGTEVLNKSMTRKSLVTHYTGLFDYPREWIPTHSDGDNYGVSMNNGFIFEFPWDRSKTDTKLPSWGRKSELGNIRAALELSAAGMKSYLESSGMGHFQDAS